MQKTKANPTECQEAAGIPRELAKRIEALRPWAYNHHVGGITINAESANRAKVHDLYGAKLLKHILGCITDKENVQSLRAIDLGCLEGHYTEVLADAGFGEVVGVDLSERHVDRAKFLFNDLHGYKHVKVILGNATDSNLISSQGKFNVVFCHGLLYHLKDPMLLFDMLDKIIPDDGPFFLLLHTQFKGDYASLVSSLPMAGLQIKPLTPGSAGGDGYLFSPKDQSVFERVSMRLNPSAIYKILQAYGYQGLIAYNTPGAPSGNYDLCLVVTRNNKPGLLSELRRGLSLPGVVFYEWDGASVNGYSFRHNKEARLVRFLVDRLFKWSNRYKLKEQNWVGRIEEMLR